MTPPVDIARLRALLAAARPLPWFWNSYSDINSKPLSDEYMRLEFELDERLKRENRESEDSDFDNFPDIHVCVVERIGGDTASGQGAHDARAIEAGMSALPALLDELEHLRRARQSYAYGIKDAISIIMVDDALRGTDHSPVVIALRRMLYEDEGGTLKREVSL